jgi:hypothetical protein
VGLDQDGAFTNWHCTHSLQQQLRVRNTVAYCEEQVDMIEIQQQHSEIVAVRHGEIAHELGRRERTVNSFLPNFR